MAAIQQFIETALYNKLTGNANLSAMVGTRVFDTFVQLGTARPYIVFQYSAGGDDNQTPRRNADVIYRVECVADDQAQARTGAGYIDETLHNQELTITGWSNWRMRAESQISLVDTVAGVQYFRKGAFYRISIASNT